MKNITHHIGKLIITGRLPHSVNGNPRFTAYCAGFNFRTAVDDGIAYEIQNYDGKEVDIMIGTHFGVATLHSIKRA